MVGHGNPAWGLGSYKQAQTTGTGPDPTVRGPINIPRSFPTVTHKQELPNSHTQAQVLGRSHGPMQVPQL